MMRRGTLAAVAVTSVAALASAPPARAQQRTLVRST